MIQFNIEAEFQKYCTMVRLDTDNCSPTQVIETRRAFYAGISQILMFLKNDLTGLPADEGIDELERITGLCGAFWKRQASS